MFISRLSRSTRIKHMLAVMLALALLFGSSGTSLAQQPESAPGQSSGAIRTAVSGGEWIPIFKVSSPKITGDTTANLAGMFSPLANQPVKQDQYLGKNRFVVGNEKTNTILEQYGATGGFYLYNATEAFSQTPRGTINPLVVQRQACNFLVNNKLLPAVQYVSTPTNNCGNTTYSEQSPYHLSLGYVQGENNQPNAPIQDPVVISAIVQVPLEVNTSQFSQVENIPLGGPGGHISLLFRTTSTDQGFSLDPQNASGLAAVAMPFHGRSLTHFKDIAARDPAEVKKEVVANVRASYPDASEVNVPDPTLLYWVSDAAQEQTLLEPQFDFEGIEVVVDGEFSVFEGSPFASGAGRAKRIWSFGVDCVARERIGVYTGRSSEPGGEHRERHAPLSLHLVTWEWNDAGRRQQGRRREH